MSVRVCERSGVGALEKHSSCSGVKPRRDAEPEIDGGAPARGGGAGPTHMASFARTCTHTAHGLHTHILQ